MRSNLPSRDRKERSAEDFFSIQLFRDLADASGTMDKAVAKIQESWGVMTAEEQSLRMTIDANQDP
jgi:hypothetical protein